MNSQETSDDLRDFAAARGLGTVGTDLFSDIEPDSSVTADPIAVFKKYGDEPDVMIYESQTPALVAPRVQVTARSANYNDAMTLARAIYGVLYQSNTRIGQGYYTMVRPMQSPQFIGPDANDRLQFSFNVRTQRYF